MSNKPIHVAMLILDYYPRVGGAQQQLSMLAPLKQAQNIQISVVTRQFPGLAAYEVVDGVPVYRLPYKGPKPLAASMFMASALRWLQKNRPDIVHAYSFLSPLTAAVMSRYLFGIPVVAKVLRGGLLGDVYRLQRKPMGKFRLDQYTKNVTAFAVISDEIEEELKSIGVPEHKRLFIPNGVDTNRFKPVSSEEQKALRERLQLQDAPTAVYTGRLVEEKRVDQLISVWPAVRERIPDATLIILGNGLEMEKLQEMAGEGVHFLGRLDDVVPHLQAADLFVLPSATEGLSNSLLEAMAVGLPVVATNVGGAPDVVSEGESGYLVPPDTPSALQQALISSFENVSHLEEMKQNARKVILDRYALQTVADKLVELYTAVHTSQMA